MIHGRPLLTLAHGLAVGGWLLTLSCCLIVPRTAECQEQDEFRIGPEDVVQIQVLNRPDLSGTRTVRRNGNVFDPYLDEVKAAGRSEAELSEELTRRYKILFPGVSNVQVTVVQYNSRTIIVTGEVRRPDRYGYRDIPDLWEIIVKDARGLTPNADAARVQIIRNEPVEGEPQIQTVDLSPLLVDAMPGPLPRLRPGDTINVPSLAAEAAAAGATFQVLGSVRNPGVYSLLQAQTLTEALAISGGPIGEANLTKVHLTRISPEGVVAFTLNLEGLLYEGRKESNLKLQEGDTVTVPVRPLGRGALFRSLWLITTSLASVVVIVDRISR